MTSVEDKLKKFQSVCEEKIKKIEHLKIQHEENARILQSFRIDSAIEYENSVLNLQLAEVHHKTGRMHKQFNLHLPPTFLFNFFDNIAKTIDDIRKEQDHQKDMRAKM